MLALEIGGLCLYGYLIKYGKLQHPVGSSYVLEN